MTWPSTRMQDALFASGLPFVLSINDVPEAWELYSRAGSIARLCSAAPGPHQATRPTPGPRQGFSG